MPFYEYECASCKFYTEVMQKISDAPLKKCPSCGKSTMKKLISAPVFRLKGGGWYETDFKSDKESKRNLAGDGSDSSDAKPKEAAGAETKTVDSKAESKPAEKASTSAPEKPAKVVASKSAAKSGARKAVTKTKTKASKRRGR